MNKHVLEINVNPTKMMAFKTLIEESGRKATVVPIAIQTMAPSPEITNKLALSPQQSVRQVICLFLADHHPAIFSENYFPEHILTTSSEDMDVNLPMNEFIKHYSVDKIAYSISDFRAIWIPEMVAKHLQLEQGDPILHSLDLFYNLQHQPLVLGYNYFRDDAFKLRIAQSWT